MLVLVPGTPGLTRQILLSVALAVVSAFSPLCQDFLVPLCQRKCVFLQLKWQLAESEEEEGAFMINF